MELEYSEKNNIGKRILQLCLGMIAGIITATITALIMSFIMTLSSVPDSMVSVAAIISTLFASFACGFVAVKLIGSGGLLHGALSGLMLFAVRSVISLIFSSPCILMNFLIAFLINTAIAAIGGVTAVNTGK